MLFLSRHKPAQIIRAKSNCSSNHASFHSPHTPTHTHRHQHKHPERLRSRRQPSNLLHPNLLQPPDASPPSSENAEAAASSRGIAGHQAEKERCSRSSSSLGPAHGRRKHRWWSYGRRGANPRPVPPSPPASSPLPVGPAAGPAGSGGEEGGVGKRWGT